MRINIIYDSSAGTAPAGFEGAVQAAAQELDNLITNSITVNIQVGWGENNGSPLNGNISTGGPSGGTDLSYAQLKADLIAKSCVWTAREGGREVALLGAQPG